jgi:hypothetical protein
MAKRVGTSQIFFADATRVEEVLTCVHALVERTEKLRYSFAFSLCEELSSCGWIVCDESTRYAQTCARSQPELSLFVLGVALVVQIVNPASIVERVEKTPERGCRLPDTHRAKTLVKIIGHPRRPELARPNSAYFLDGSLLSCFR